MFPQLVFRKAYEAIQEVQAGTRGDLENLRILDRAARTTEVEVVAALWLPLDAGTPITAEAVKELTSSSKIEVPALVPATVDPAEYDTLRVQELTA